MEQKCYLSGLVESLQGFLLFLLNAFRLHLCLLTSALYALSSLFSARSAVNFKLDGYRHASVQTDGSEFSRHFGIQTDGKNTRQSGIQTDDKSTHQLGIQTDHTKETNKCGTQTDNNKVRQKEIQTDNRKTCSLGIQTEVPINRQLGTQTEDGSFKKKKRRKRKYGPPFLNGKSNEPPDKKLDLHGMYKDVAVKRFEKFCSDQYHIYAENGYKGEDKRIYIITGVGKNSKSNIAVIKPEIERRVKEMKLRANESNRRDRYCWYNDKGAVMLTFSQNRDIRDDFKLGWCRL